MEPALDFSGIPKTHSAGGFLVCQGFLFGGKYSLRISKGKWKELKIRRARPD